MIHTQFTSLIAAGLIFASANASAEDFTNAFTKCAVTKDDRQRLACYDRIRDGIATSYSAKPTGYQPINLVDLKVDIKTLSGKRLVVPALIQVMGEISMLKSDEMDMAPVWAGTSELPRDDRKKLASGCQALLCKGRFYGVVKNTPMGLGLALEKVEWQ